MKTYLDCIPCFYQQALRAARISGANEEVQREVLNGLSAIIPDFSLDTTPTVMGRKIYTMINKITGKKDPYREIKEESNKIAIKLYPQIRDKVNNSENKLLTALKLAIIGNIIDYTFNNGNSIEKKVESLLEYDFGHDFNNDNHFKYLAFLDHLVNSQMILYLADNAGEVIFDRILIELLVEKYNKTVIYVVKGKPVLNGALVDDAIFCGINQYAKIISCGADSPGVVLEYCSSEFMRLFNEAEMIISKGQGNYEALSNKASPLFFLLIAKCQIISKHIGCQIGDFILENNINKEMVPINYIKDEEIN